MERLLTKGCAGTRNNIGKHAATQDAHSGSWPTAIPRRICQNPIGTYRTALAVSIDMGVCELRIAPKPAIMWATHGVLRGRSSDAQPNACPSPHAPRL